MNSVLRQTISLFIDNYHTLKKALFWKASPEQIRLCAFTYAFGGIRVVPEKINESITYIRAHTKWYSPLRASSLLIAAFLSASGSNLDASFARLMVCYKSMKKAGFRSSRKLPAAAMALYSTTGEGFEKTRAESSFELYRRIMRLHLFITASAEYSTPVIMAASGRNPEDILRVSEETLRLMGNLGSYSTNALQFLARLLAFDSSQPSIKAARCADIYDMLKRMKLKLPVLCYGTIGFLALAGDHWQDAAREALDTISLLKLGKCFMSRDKEHALMFSSALVVSSYLIDGQKETTNLLRACAGTTIQSVIEAQIITCSASSAAVKVSAASF